ncbi:MAG TPA: hypothetical protein VNV88_11515 [Candidatus Solibacter sp.]|jgi:hypothetical protein|nr:hypothetical protein [Candidatus Solibacter sp.]
MRRNWIVRALRMALFIVVACAVLGFIVMHLWNWLMPEISGWHAISFWQALGLLLLSKLLFGGFRGGWGHSRHWRKGMRERWEQMTPEQREELRKNVQARCGYFWGPASAKTELKTE